MPANIAEGFARLQRPDKVRYYNIAQASAEELRYFLILSRDLKYAVDSALPWDSLDQACRMLGGLVKVVRAAAHKRRSAPRA